MKNTVHVNIGSQAFTLDEDAYATLKSYLDDIGSRLPGHDAETMSDIEARIAEIFREKIASPMRVISIETVRETMRQMGDPAEFGERSADESGPAAPERPRLYRSRTNRSIAGICGGIAEFFDADATLIRLVTLLLILFGGLSIWIYVILWIVIPEAPLRKFEFANNDKQR